MASVYDVMYGFKHYAAEASRVDALIRERKPDAQTLLDVACGTGKHLEAFQHLGYTVEGADVSRAMLAIARERLPDAQVYEADMRTLSLGTRYDAVTCLFSAIGYAHTTDELNETVLRLASHLVDNGVLVVEPFLDPAMYETGRIDLLVREEPGVKVARMNTTDRVGDLAILEFQWLVGRPTGIQHFSETHELAMFGQEEYVAAFRRAGLNVERDREGLTGRGLYIGVRQ